MKRTYRHVIITRFSVRFNMETEKNGNLFDLDRLKKRMEVFKAVCLPSLLKQSWKNFYWVILIDSKLPSDYKDELMSIASKHKFIRILEWKPDHYKLWKIDWLKDAGINIDVNHIITTRLDDDDALHKSFTQTVQRYYKTGGYLVKSLMFITFPSGLIWNRIGMMMNPFSMNFIALGMTLIAATREYPINVYGFNHAKLKNSYRARFKNPPYIYKWLTNKLGRTVTYRHFHVREIMASLPTRFPMYIYALHGHNDSAEKYYKKLFRNGGVYKRGEIKQLLRYFGK